MLFFKRKVIGFKSEATPGTDPVPTAAANAMLVRNFKITPIDQDSDPRNLDLNYVGNLGNVPGGARVKFDFDVELAGAGAAGSAAPYGALLKACGMSETLNAAVSAVYAPVNPGGEVSGTLYFWMGGRLHKAVYCVGDVKLDIQRGKIPVLTFSMIGIYATPTDVALPAPTLTAFQKPVVMDNVNTTPVTLHGFAGKFDSLSLTVGNSVTYRNLVASESVRLTDRASVGAVTLEDELVATIDWWTKVRTGALGALSVQHGTVAGNIVVAAAPNVQLMNPTMDQQDNISMLSMALALQPSSAGNDEFSITVK